jgi:hypothetical protein
MLSSGKRCTFEIVQILSFECVSATLLSLQFWPYACRLLSI